MKCLILGVNGLLGQACVRFAPKNTSLMGVDLQDDSFLGIDYASLDLANPEILRPFLDDYQPDLVINAAAFTNVDLCEDERDVSHRINAELPAWLAQNVERLVHISTDYVFDGTSGPYSEDDDVNPQSMYGQSKLDSERAVLSASTKHLVLRTMTVYGNGANLRPSFVDFVADSLRAGKTINIVSDQIGNPTLVNDLAQSIWTLTSAQQSGLFNCSGTTICSRLDWAQLIARKNDLDQSLIKSVTTAELGQKAVRPLNSGFNLSKIQAIPGVKLHSLEEQFEIYNEEKNGK